MMQSAELLLPPSKESLISAFIESQALLSLKSSLKSTESTIMQFTRK